jgi:hypothetical protein
MNRRIPLSLSLSSVAQSQYRYYRLALSPAWRRFHLSFSPILAQGASTMHPARHPRLQKRREQRNKEQKDKTWKQREMRLSIIPLYDLSSEVTATNHCARSE